MLEFKFYHINITWLINECKEIETFWTSVKAVFFFAKIKTPVLKKGPVLVGSKLLGKRWDKSFIFIINRLEEKKKIKLNLTKKRYSNQY